MKQRRVQRQCAPRAFASALVGALILLAARSALAQQEAGTAVYVRSDTDRTTVIAPRLRAATPIGEATKLELVYSMDIWTSASVDIRASASKRLPDGRVEPITEQRDEINVRASHELDALTLNVGYRYSTEPDYKSNGGSIGVSHDFADKSATLALDAVGTFDRVGRAGDPGFERDARNLSGRLSFTQVLDRQTLLQAIYELGQAQGFLSSPYRFIGLGTPDGYCSGATVGNYCVPETNPNVRLRHAAALRLRRALGPQFSLGANYRFYLDDWGLVSHTIIGELSFAPDPATVLSLRYRFYTQGAADQYSSHYAADADKKKFYTNDKELSPFTSHRVALDLEHIFVLDDPSKRLRTVLSIAPSIFQYSDFKRLSEIKALEVTLATVFEL